MATLLDKDLTRETNIKIDEREIQITLTEDQKVSLKLKGMKSGILSISIEELYNQLVGEKPILPVVQAKVKDNDGVKLSLHDIRHKCNVRGFDYSTMVKIDTVFDELIEENRK